jgi:hypothetical protein
MHVPSAHPKEAPKKHHRSSAVTRGIALVLHPLQKLLATFETRSLVSVRARVKVPSVELEHARLEALLLE